MEILQLAGLLIGEPDKIILLSDEIAPQSTFIF